MDGDVYDLVECPQHLIPSVVVKIDGMRQFTGIGAGLLR